MHLWEKREVPRPPEYTIQYSTKEFVKNNLGECVHPLLDGISRGHTALTDERVSLSLRKEVAILTASLYRNGRHRNEKFYRVLKKVEKSCARWQKLDVVEELDRLCHLMPRMVLERKTLRLPSKQMFEYLLARLLGTYHLMLHLDGICSEAAALLLSKIATGHFFSTAVAFLSNVARIRVLALDYGGQVAKIYDDIKPKVNLLKGSNAPPLVDTATLPSSLSCLLQQYCASFDVNRNALPVSKPSSDISFLNSLNITKEEDSANTSKTNEFTDSPVTKNLVNEEFYHSESRAYDRQDMSVSSCYLVEDIGECVPSTKPHKKAETVKKRKLSQETNGNMDTNDGHSSTKKKVKSGSGVNVSLKSKKKKAKKNLLKSDVRKIKQNKIRKSLSSEPDEEHFSAEFIKHFKAVKKQTQNIKSIDSLEKFIEGEKRNRSGKVNGRVSVLLKKEEWREFSKFLGRRLKNIKGLSQKDSGDSEAVQQLLGKTRVRVKFWLLFPHLKGKKPGNWKTVLGQLSS